VEAFLRDALPFTQIPVVIERVLSRHRVTASPALDQILQADIWARRQVAELLTQEVTR